MEVDSIFKVARRVEWKARGFFRPAPVEVLYEGGSEQNPEYIKRIPGPVYLEPLYGYPITADGVLIEEAMDSHFPMPNATWRNGLPSPRWFRETIRRAELVDHHRSVVSLRHFWEWNYYHFHLDILGKLKLLGDQGVSRDLPMALGRYARELPFAREILKMGRLAKRDWLIPDIDNRRIILADELIYCRIHGLTYRDRVSCVLDEMELPPPQPHSNAKIFVNREPPALRRISNFEELRPLIVSAGFKIIDTAKLSVREQIETFSGTRYLAAMHGAGVTNIIYRRGLPLSVLEVHADTYINDDMKRMSGEFAYAYHRLACQPVKGANPQQASIHVKPAELRRALDELLAT